MESFLNIKYNNDKSLVLGSTFIFTEIVTKKNLMNQEKNEILLKRKCLQFNNI